MKTVCARLTSTRQWQSSPTLVAVTLSSTMVGVSPCTSTTVSRCIYYYYLYFRYIINSLIHTPREFDNYFSCWVVSFFLLHPQNKGTVKCTSFISCLSDNPEVGAHPRTPSIRYAEVCAARFHYYQELRRAGQGVHTTTRPRPVVHTTNAKKNHPLPSSLWREHN